MASVFSQVTQTHYDPFDKTSQAIFVSEYNGCELLGAVLKTPQILVESAPTVSNVCVSLAYVCCKSSAARTRVLSLGLLDVLLKALALHNGGDAEADFAEQQDGQTPRRH